MSEDSNADGSSEEPAEVKRQLQSELDDIRERAAPLKAESDRAAAYGESDTRKGHFIGLTADPSLELHFMSQHRSFSISTVSNPPGLVNLTRALRNDFQDQYALLGNQSGRVTHEIWIDGGLGHRTALNVGSTVVYLLRIACGWPAQAIGYADVPWSSIAAKQGTVKAHVLGSEWSSRAAFHERTPTKDDLVWVDDRLFRSLELLASPAFRLAFDAAGQANFTSSLRMSTSMSWSGIEALIGASQELSYRISMYLSVLLSEDATERVRIYRGIKKLYSLRSKAVHGVVMKSGSDLETARQSWKLLRDALRAIIELGEDIPGDSRYDEVLLGDRFKRVSSQIDT